MLKNLRETIRRKIEFHYRIRYTKFFGTAPGYPVEKPVDTYLVEILADADFQRSCKEVAKLTLLDTPRLANLWSLCRMTNPKGNILEIGSFQGGGALHLSNSCPDRKIIVCDSFSGFEELHPELDTSFRADMFKNTTHESVDRLFRDRGRNYAILAGFFPGICQEKNFNPGPLSFVHLDVDIYKATIESLEYIAPLMLDRSMIVLDDFNRSADGVNRGVAEFTQKHPEWVVFPLFPSQGLLVHEGWFPRKGATK